MAFFGRLRSWFTGRFRPILHIAGDEGTGPVVILVHGIASSSITFQNLVPLLSDSHRVISIDLLGHGESPIPANATYTVEEHVEWLSRTIRSLRLRHPVTIVGHSLGALLVSRYSRLNPKRVAKTVLVSPPIYLPPDQVPDRLERLTMDAYLRAYEYLRANKAFTLRNAAIVARLMPVKNLFDLTEHNWKPFVLSLQNCIESQTTISDIAGIAAPVEVVYGSLDQFLAPAGLRIVEQLRHVHTVVVDGNDHLVRKRLARAVAAAIDSAAVADPAGALD